MGNKKMIGYFAILLANFIAMFLISGIGVMAYAVAGEYDAVMSVSMIFTLESSARCAIMPLSGKLGEKFGRRNLFLFALILYTICYAIATFVTGFWIYTIARTISGVAWGLWVTNSFVLMNDVFGHEDTTKLSGYAQTASTVAMMLASPLAGILCATALGWRLEYYIALPILVVTIVLAFIGIPKVEKDDRGKPMDVMGSVSTVIFLIAFALTMNWGPTYGWNSPLIIALIVITVIGGAMLLISEKKAADPIYPIRVLKNRLYMSIFFISLLFSVANAAFNYLPTYLQYYAGIDSVRTGFVTLPSLIIAAILTSIFGNYVAKHMKYRGIVIFWGFGALATGILLCFLEAPFAAAIPFVYAIIATIPMGSVGSCSQIVPYTYPLNVLKPEEIAIGMSFMGVAGVFGNTMANGILGALMNGSGGMISCFKVPLIASIIMIILCFLFKDIKKGETL